jgi:hypothetical protein
MLSTKNISLKGCTSATNTNTPSNNSQLFKPILDFEYTQEILFKKAKELNYTFLFSKDNPELNKKGKHTKLFSASKDINTFLSYYNTLETNSKHFYETVHSKFYEFYDLDLSLEENSDPEIFNNSNLFLWFDLIRSEFIKFIINNNTNKELDLNFNFLSHPEWIITTASNQTKLSLHIINRNVTFNENKVFKQFYSSFKSYVESFVQNDNPFKKSIDWCVSSLNRSMRMIDSTKIGGNRRLYLWNEYHLDYVPLHKTFITDAINDNLFDKKLITNDIYSNLFLSNVVTIIKENTVSTNKINKINKKSCQYKFECNIEEIAELLTILSDKRATEYEHWLTISWALKNGNIPFEVFDIFSKRTTKNNYKYEECLNHWNSISSDIKKTPVTLGSIHYYAKQDNPEQYKNFVSKYRKPIVNFPFTPDYIFNTKYIESNIYSNYLSQYDILAMNSNMNTGKTYNIPTIFDKYKRIVVVYFRVSLNTELFKKWEQFGFEYYKNIKGDINTEEHPRIIIQLDSIGRLTGGNDLLILDEVESLQSHLCSSKFIKNKQYIFTILKNYVKHTPKLILADANLSDYTVNLFTSDKNDDKIVKLQNTYKSLSHIKCTVLHKKEKLIKTIKQFLSDGKKLVIPTNSKKFCKQITKIINNEFPSLKVLSIYPENKKQNNTNQIEENITTEDWVNYDVLTYTPTICAGISFEKLHFNTCIAYFTNKSCNAEMCTQMLLRVRNLIDNQFYIYTPFESSSINLPINNSDIEEFINSIIKNGHSHLIQEGLSLDHFNQKVRKDKYYLLYKEYIKKKNITSLYLNSYLKNILMNHGVYIKEDFSIDLTDEEKDKLNSEIVAANIEIKKEEVNDIINATPINGIDEYNELKNKRTEKSKDEINSINRFYLTSSFGLKNDYEFIITDCKEPYIKDEKTNSISATSYWVETNIKHIKGYNHFKYFKELTLDEAIEKCERIHSETYNNKLITDYDDLQSSSSDEVDHELQDDSESENTFNFVKKINKIKSKKSVRKTIVTSIHYDKRWLKLKQCFHFLKAVGFERLNDIKKIKLNWNALHTYCKENEDDIYCLFDCKRMYWKEELDNNEKLSLSKYVNKKLESMLGINFEKISKNSLEYKIINLFIL